jgi:quinoprotein glucose dehydrogenase
VIARGGLVFIAATKHGKLRAFNKTNGKLLWETTLPVPGYATPSI